MQGFGQAAVGLFYRCAASGALPASWFRTMDGERVARAKRTGRLNLEIVSHCWQYDHLLTYQLSSLVTHRTDKLHVTMTVYHAAGDEPVMRLLRFFQGIELPNVAWNWVPLPKERLFRRSIGRNLAARGTRADWIWFTDADVVFHEGCLDALADLLQGRDDPLVYPRTPRGTSLLTEDHDILREGRTGLAVRKIPLEAFSLQGPALDKATGPYQIAHGDVARALGYCASIDFYQRPAPRWRKAYEDRAFRWLLGTPGTPINVPGVCRIRHVAKGRYRNDSLTGRLRTLMQRRRDRQA